MACYEDVVDAAEVFLFEQPSAFEELLKKKGVEAEFDYDWGGYSERTIRWACLCLPRN